MRRENLNWITECPHLGKHVLRCRQEVEVYEMSDAKSFGPIDTQLSSVVKQPKRYGSSETLLAHFLPMRVGEGFIVHPILAALHQGVALNGRKGSSEQRATPLFHLTSRLRRPVAKRRHAGSAPQAGRIPAGQR